MPRRNQLFAIAKVEARNLNCRSFGIVGYQYQPQLLRHNYSRPPFRETYLNANLMLGSRLARSYDSRDKVDGQATLWHAKVLTRTLNHALVHHGVVALKRPCYVACLQFVKVIARLIYHWWYLPESVRNRLNIVSSNLFVVISRRKIIRPSCSHQDH